MHRVVIDTSVHFTLTQRAPPDESAVSLLSVSPPHETASVASTHPLVALAAPTKRGVASTRSIRPVQSAAAKRSCSSAESRSRPHRIRSNGHARAAKKALSPHRQPSVDTLHDTGDCSPWDSGDHSASLAHLELIVSAAASKCSSNSDEHHNETQQQQSPTSSSPLGRRHRSQRQQEQSIAATFSAIGHASSAASPMRQSVPTGTTTTHQQLHQMRAAMLVRATCF